MRYFVHGIELDLTSGISQSATPGAMINMANRGKRRLERIAMLLRAAVAAFFALTAAAQAADCPRQGVLGTSRVLTVDAASFPRVGLKSFAQTLPLAAKEVVLTF